MTAVPPDPVTVAIDVLQEKWAMHVVEALQNGASGFNELSRTLGVNPTTLSERLVRLEHLGMVRKTTYASQPPRSVIELLPAGVAFKEVLVALNTWGAEHLQLSEAVQQEPGTIEVMQGKWAMQLMRELLGGPRRFNELARQLGGANSTTLAQRIGRLERLGLVRKTTLSLLPPRSSVELTGAGLAMKPVFVALEQWAAEYVEVRT